MRRASEETILTVKAAPAREAAVIRVTAKTPAIQNWQIIAALRQRFCKRKKYAKKHSNSKTVSNILASR